MVNEHNPNWGVSNTDAVDMEDFQETAALEAQVADIVKVAPVSDPPFAAQDGNAEAPS